ncbi:hypothetical protein [Paraglaciecola hydrolytica]|uniref:hypothetical protein n=1 Tax=Paraglaciecola hydrolytica TaxID=1799789 RepID=UPI0012FE972C|nr:hypothetical protein [Paraglaciecola hydrolytica]
MYSRIFGKTDVWDELAAGSTASAALFDPYNAKVMGFKNESAVSYPANWMAKKQG